MSKVLKFKINQKRTKVRSYVRNFSKNLLKELHNMKKYESEFKNYDKEKNLIFKFLLDENNNFIQSIDDYSKYWHGIFGKEKIEYNEEFSSKEEKIYGCKTNKWYRIGGFDATVVYNYIVTVGNKNSGLRVSPSIFLAHPHKIDTDPNFVLCDQYHIVFDSVI